MLIQLTKKSKEELEGQGGSRSATTKMTKSSTTTTEPTMEPSVTSVNSLKPNQDDDLKSLTEYAERVKKEETPSSSHGTFSLISKMLFFSERKNGSLRLCIPCILIDDILHLCHDNCGHQGHRRTYL